MAVVVREVTCLVNSDNERNRIARLCRAPHTFPRKLGQTHLRRSFFRDGGRYGDGRSVMPLDALDRTRNTMAVQARKFPRKGLQIARKTVSVGIGDCNFSRERGTSRSGVSLTRHE
jgi:hypothetical protein